MFFSFTRGSGLRVSLRSLATPSLAAAARLHRLAMDMPPAPRAQIDARCRSQTNRQIPICPPPTTHPPLRAGLPTTCCAMTFRMPRWCWSISSRMVTTARTSGTSMTGNMRPNTTASTRCLSECCFRQEFKKPLPGQGQRLELTFSENYFTCGLSGRINEKPDGGVLPDLPEPTEKVWPWWAQGLQECQ